MPLLQIDNVSKAFRRGSGPFTKAVDSVSLTIEQGSTLAVIGESGSGKSTLGRLAVRLYDIDSGVVTFDGVDLATLSASGLRDMRAQMQVVFQEPYQSLNPKMRVGEIISEPLEIHRPGMKRAARAARVAETLADVGLSPDLASRRPSELSGGQQQRIGIARAIITEPRLLILDEPTSSLDLSIRGQVLNLLGRLQKKYQMAYMFISHDLATVSYFSDHVVVMRKGAIVESGSMRDVLDSPQHPYTISLLSAALDPDPDVHHDHIPYTD